MQEAIARFRKATETDPKSAIYHHFLGHTLSVTQQWEEAILSYRQALELAPDAAIIYQHLGDALSTLQRWQQAVTAYHHSVELDPNSLEAQDHLGFALAQLQRWEEAIAAYRRALNITQSDVVYQHLGEAFQNRSPLQPVAKAAQADLEEAAQCYRRVIELNPTWVSTYKLLGDVLTQLGQTEEAELCYHRAQES